MINICLYFQAHQPFRIRELSFFEIGDKPEIFDFSLDKKILARVLKNSYMPAFDMFSRLIGKSRGKFNFGISFTGLLLEQLAQYQPGVIKTIADLIATGSAEVLGETYYHSFASLYSSREFEDQVRLHKQALEKYFGYEPQVFRNTELAYRSDIPKTIDKLGFNAILIEGSDRTLKGKSGNYLYSSAASGGLKILTRNQEYSNIFTSPGVSAKRTRKFPGLKDLIKRISEESGDLIIIGFDIECLGEHLKASSGIFGYFEEFIMNALKSKQIEFVTPSEARSAFKPKGVIEVYSPVTWHIKSNDISAWNGNAMQIEAMKYIYGLEEKLKSAGQPQLLDSWRKLQSSDHMLYMDTMETEEGRPAQLYSPFKSPHQAYIYLMNALASIELAAGADA
ncbi:MAG TPA: hypothetical protein VI583_07660 [Cyclobacteriaceae bacterium]|nr:hypothetical protein [Cyclobacteriaceae bacterium]